MFLLSFVTADKMKKLKPECSRVLAARNKTKKRAVFNAESSFYAEMRVAGGVRRQTCTDAENKNLHVGEIIYKPT